MRPIQKKIKDKQRTSYRITCYEFPPFLGISVISAFTIKEPRHMFRSNFPLAN
jgi:hypothetical protein